MELVDRAAALYALPLDRFVVARNLAAKECAQGGDKELAAALRKLPKPSSAAWLVNLLVTRRREEVEQVLELAASLREAQSSLDRAQLHALGQQRQRLIAAVARQALEAASEVGHDVGPAALPDVEQTLRAALADQAAAAAVLTGRLIRTLEATGWDAVDLTDAVGGPFDAPASQADHDGGDEAEAGDDGGDDGGTGTRTGTRARTRAGAGAEAEAGAGDDDETGAGRPARAKRSAAERRTAEARAKAARSALASAEEEATRTDRAAQRLATRRDGLTASLEDLEDRIGALRRELADLEEEAAQRCRDQEAARKALEAAEQAEQAARSALEDLDR